MLGKWGGREDGEGRKELQDAVELIFLFAPIVSCDPPLCAGPCRRYRRAQGAGQGFHPGTSWTSGARACFTHHVKS